MSAGCLLEPDESVVDDEDNTEDKLTSEQNTPVSSEDPPPFDDADHSEDLNLYWDHSPFEDEGASEDEVPTLESVEVVDPSINISVSLPQMQTLDEQSNGTATERKRKKISKQKITFCTGSGILLGTVFLADNT